MIKETSGDLSGGISQKQLQKMLKKFGKKGLRSNQEFTTLLNRFLE